MANRIGDMGMDVQISRRVNSKYDPYVEKEVIDWVNQITAENIQTGRENVAAALKDGQVLVKLINVIYDGTPELPPSAARLRRPFKANTSKASFKMMENIEIFVNACSAYGVQKTGLFQTVDLFEMRNMTQVINSLYQLGTECQRHNFSGPVCGPKPTYENKREFSAETLAASSAIIGLQAGSNKGASQSGMSMGAVRHVADMKVDPMSAAGQSVIGLQYGSNKGASQSGMSMGAVRHIADIRADDLSESGKNVIGLQAGSNKGATQSGMSMGAVRHIADIRADDLSQSGKNVIGLQAGSNKGATQSGMAMGATRHITDIKVGEMSAEGKNILGLQAGSNEGASQSGMSFGAQRHITDVQVGGTQK